MVIALKGLFINYIIQVDGGGGKPNADIGWHGEEGGQGKNDRLTQHFGGGGVMWSQRASGNNFYPKCSFGYATSVSKSACSD